MTTSHKARIEKGIVLRRRKEREEKEVYTSLDKSYKCIKVKSKLSLCGSRRYSRAAEVKQEQCIEPLPKRRESTGE